MIKPDVIVLWPTAYDYPVFRNQINKYRELFGKIIVPVNRNSVVRNLLPWLIETNPSFTFVDPSNEPNQEMWYNACIKRALKESTSEYVLFTEQDFVISNDKLLPEIFSSQFDVVHYQHKKFRHPYFFLTKRSLIDKTSQHFDIVVDKKDQFEQFENEIATLTNNIEIVNNIATEEDCYHIGGITFVYHIADMIKFDGKSYGDILPLIRYNRKINERIRKYNLDSLNLNIPQHPQWIDVMERTEKMFAENYSYLLEESWV